MRVVSSFYEVVNYQQYLTVKYGNWKIPVKDWDSTQEKQL